MSTIGPKGTPDAAAFSLAADHLRDIGYPGATRDNVREYWKAWKAGIGRDEGDVVYRFAADIFAKHPDVFGERQGAGKLTITIKDEAGTEYEFRVTKPDHMTFEDAATELEDWCRNELGDND